MKTKLYTFLTLVFFLSFANLNAQTLIVNNNGDTSDAIAGDGVCDDGFGHCTLRAAIEEANANASITQIHFSNTLIITPAAALPAITQSGLTIDGTSAPSASCGVLVENTSHNLFVEISGSGASYNGITVNAQNVLIRGLVIRGFDGNTFVSGIRANQNNVTIECCYLGTNASGSSADGNTRGVYTSNSRSNITIQNSLISGNSVSGVQPGLAASIIVKGNLIGTNVSGTSSIANDIGVYLLGTSGSVIGGTINTEKNIISGNTLSGIAGGPIGSIGSTFIYGNYIGTSIDGTNALANGEHGIDMGNGGLDYTIGGSGAGEGNIISGNTLYGIDVNNGVIIQGNFIGTDIGGTITIPNQSGGILINTGKSDITIGGTTPNAGNTIAFNLGDGIEINSAAGQQNPIQKNRIYSNAGIGIDINADGMTANDAMDNDAGANNVQNTPSISASFVNNNVVNITFSVDTDISNAAYPLSIDFYRADAGGEEGEVYLGTVIYSASDAMTDKSVTFTPASPISLGEFIVATATDNDGNTSEFSSQSILPVELIRFVANEKEKTALLQWTTASEINNLGFEIEHNHSDEWNTIGFVEGKEILGLENNYGFQTEKLSSGIHYFRLRQIDLDGAYTYSDITSLKIQNSNTEVKAYPNPTSGFLNLNIEANQNTRSIVQIFDLQGRIAKEYTYNLEKGSNQQVFDLIDLKSGQYILHIKMDDENIVRKIVKE